MYSIKRVTEHPASPMQVQVDGKPDGGPDGQFQQGGVYYFMPAGQENDTHQVTEHVARVIMGDPGMRHHFECDPPLPGQPDGATAGKAKATKGDKG